MSKNVTENKSLMNDLLAQFKIEYSKITGLDCHGNSQVINSGNCFYFRTDNEGQIKVRNPATGFTSEMGADDADFLASMLAVTALGWNHGISELFACNSAMHKECRASRPEVIEFIG